MYKIYFVTFFKKMHLVLRFLFSLTLCKSKAVDNQAHTHNNSFFQNSNAYIANLDFSCLGHMYIND